MRNPFRYFNISPEVIRLVVMMLIGDDPQCYPSYRDNASGRAIGFSKVRSTFTLQCP
jgi:hypothetical protein